MKRRKAMSDKMVCSFYIEKCIGKSDIYVLNVLEHNYEGSKLETKSLTLGKKVIIEAFKSALDAFIRKDSIISVQKAQGEKK
jgi:hypothetical protein